MELKEYARMQVEEALGPVNRWYCSEHYRREITEPNILIEYYIKHGGAEHFARRRIGLASGRNDFVRSSLNTSAS
jgi:hypothetical protein